MAQKTTIDELQVLITANAASFEKRMNAVRRQLDSLDGKQSKMQKGFMKSATAASFMGNVLAKMVASAFRAISSSMGDAISRLDTLNNFPKVMSNLGISSEESQKSIDILSDKLLGLPTTLDDATLAVQRFTAANGNIKASTGIFLALNNAILAGGAPMELQRSALEQMSQAYAKGKPDMMEWRTLMQAMPAQLTQVAKAMKLPNASALGEGLREGTISMNSFMNTISRLNREGVDGFQSFEEQARNSTGGVQTSLVNLKNAVVRMTTAVMDAIGQLNISGFINGIYKAIVSVTPYIAAFTKLVMTAIGALSALFGGKSAKIQSKTTESLNASGKSAGNLADSADSAGKSLAGANKQAKKLKGTLASFDEMNVLQEPDKSSGGGSGDSGGGGGGGALSIEVPGWDEQSSAVADKATEIFESMMAKINKAFDFSKMENSIKVFANGFKKALDGVGKIGDKFIKNFLLPVAKFQIESTIPRVLEAIGKALEGIDFTKISDATSGVFTHLAGIVNSISSAFADIVEVLAPVGEWFANFVMPPALEILSTVLMIIRSAFDGIWQALQYIGAILEPIFSTLGKQLAPLLDLLGKLFNWIQKNETIMNILKSTFMALTVVILGPIVAALAALGAALTAVTWLVNTAVKMFVSGWESVKVVWSMAGKFFSDVWSKIAKAFEDTKRFFADMFTNAFNAVKNVWNGLGSFFSGIWNGVKNTLSGVINWVSTTFSNAWRNAWNGVSSIFSDIANGLGNIFKAPINFIIGIINGFIRGLNKIKIPDWVPAVGGKGINIPEIPKLARGGLVSGATIAMIGEAGREAVLPLDRNTGWMDELADKIGNTGGRQIGLLLRIDGKDIPFSAEVIADSLNDAAFLRNQPLISI